LSKSRLLTQHNQEIAQWSPDPFPCERVVLQEWKGCNRGRFVDTPKGWNSM